MQNILTSITPEAFDNLNLDEDPKEILGVVVDMCNHKLLEHLGSKDEYKRLPKGSIDIWKKMAFLAIKKGKLETLKWLCNNKNVNKEGLMDEASRKGQLECLKWMYEQKFPHDFNIEFNAAENGNIEILEYLHSVGYEFDETIEEAAMLHAEPMKILKYLHSIGHRFEYLQMVAIDMKNIEVLEWLKSLGYSYGYDTLQHAVSSISSDVRVFEILLPPRVEDLDVETMMMLSEEGSLEILKLLHSKGFYIDADSAFYGAETRRDRKKIQWLSSIFEAK